MIFADDRDGADMCLDGLVYSACGFKSEAEIIPGAVVLGLRGNLLYLTGHDHEAIQVLSALVAREPSNWDARYALGRVYYFNDRPENSCAEYEAMTP